MVLVAYKVIMLVIGIILTLIRIRLVKKRTEDSPYYDLISFSSGIGLCLAVFGFVYIEDPGVEYAMVSVSIILLVTSVLVVVFVKKVSGLILIDRQIYFKHSDRQTDRQTDGQSGGWTGGQADRRMDRQTDRQIVLSNHKLHYLTEDQLQTIKLFLV